ncbi:BTAD domain-containing putative transcriptional regulator [Streptomyces sp. S.PB5]|uniref:AfsR/SARP family transcriptional regulator n=1 Tax=Streptomyces sp. S.PB5 TaxID=3020844 RepID=UPI0025AFA05D|nr:BTAD domain-containing putative transcriptional regulator [Streptomyces sp. S.PB5]MDN3023931.1 BTAD domain-containing putative transcriptional regulator [Streptomyces sp. S.PB5]
MRYRILGVTQAEDDQGTVIPLGGPRLRALLTALALRPGAVTAQNTLIDDVWGADPPQDAPAALQALVGRLRRTLGKDAITSAPGGYRLTATRDDVDLFVFEHLTRAGIDALHAGDPRKAAHALDQALALWRGPALADLPDRTSATRPEALRLEATRARAEADLRLGRAQEAVPELTELTTTHPYDEPLHALLIRALRDTGRNADALAAYERARRTLADGLGTDPGPELRSLHTELLTPHPAREPRPAPAHPTSSHRAPTPPAPPAPPTPPEPPTPRGNLRPRLTSFVGREPELVAIRSELHRARLVTLTGPGGSGKTRLAEEAAAEEPEAWLVELARLDRPEAVPGAVVSALGLRETKLITSELVVQQDDPLALLVEYCAPRSQLLILDNCEHVIEAAAHLAETLLTRCPGLTILATSREPLGVPGESVRPVEPLVPDQAHRLFKERATAVRPDADVVLRDSEAVAEICRRLDGLPLAIELAAARLRLLTPRQIADRLDDRFRLLTSGSRTVLPRQQTLRAVVDWSWDLLDEQERTVLREVSVFAGGWDLAAAEAVCSGPVAELLGALVDKSLIVAAPCERSGPAAMRYRMLETIHEYAVERAVEAPHARADALRRHRAWARALVEEAEPRLRSARQLPWISRLETELDNIRAALHRAIEAGDEAEAAALAVAMTWFWWLRNYRREGGDWTGQVLRLGAALDAAGGALPADRDTACSLMTSLDHVDAFLAAPDGQRNHPLHTLRMDVRMLNLFLMAEVDPPRDGLDRRMREYVARIRDHFGEGGPQAARLPGLAWPVTVFFLPGPVDAARPFLDRAVANCRAHGGDWETGVMLMFRTHMVVDSPGGMEGIDEDLAELRVLSRRVGDRWLRAQVCSAAGEAAMARGRSDEAEGEFEEALRLAHEVGAHAEKPFLLARLAEIAFRRGDRTRTQTLLDEASAAAERYAVADSQAFVLLERAWMALDDKDPGRARELYEATCEAMGRATPPPQFKVMLKAVDAMVTAAESGPGSALPKVVDALRMAIDTRCSDVVRAGLADGTAYQLSQLGDHPRAARLLATGYRWRGGLPRPMPERTDVERAEADTRAALGAERYLAEYEKGSALTPDDVLAELDEALRAQAVDGGP